MSRPAPSAPRSRRHHRVGVFLCRHHSLASLALALDTFRMANQVPRADRFEIHRLSADGHPVPHPDGTLAVDGGLEQLPQMDLVVVPSLWTDGPAAVAENAAAIAALAQLPEQVLVATLCTGAYLLAASGRLDGRTATTHWMLADGLRARYPQVDLRPTENLTQDGPLICSGGSLAAVDGCLHAVQLLAGRDTAKAVARLLVTGLDRGPQTLYTPPTGWKRHADREVRELEDWIAHHHAEPFTLQELAARVHMSVRTLQRRFVAATGFTPIQYQQALRIEQAKDLLEGDRLPVPEVAARVGYQDRVAFGRLFKKATGMTPAAWRQRRGT